MGPDGAMYLAAHAQGSVSRLAPKTIPAGCAAAVVPPDGGAGTGGAGGAGVRCGGSGARVSPREVRVRAGAEPGAAPEDAGARPEGTAAPWRRGGHRG